MKTSEKEIIHNYYNAWVENDKKTVQSLLARDLHFKSPNDEFHSAEEFLKDYWKYSSFF